MPRKTAPTDDAPKPPPVRRSDALPIADMANARSGRKVASASAAQRTPPSNARVVKPAYKTGTVSPREVRAAIKRLRATGEIA
ncbi:MAG TPA: hypothetical protein VHG93_28495 [Longimicrobium sp.]|nr:hypothetical protein [Longimicrobium sp.]